MFLHTKLIVSLLMGLALTGSASAAAMKSAEDARETSTSSITFPASDTGILYFNDCDACNKNPLQLATTTKLMVGSRLVSFNEFKTAFESTSNQLVTIFYKPDTHLVTRVVLTPRAATT